MHQSSHRNLFTFFSVLTMLIGHAGAMDARERRSLPAVQELVDTLKAQLGIDAIVTAAVAPANPLLVSVKPVDRGRSRFHLVFEERFLAELAEDDLKAIIAHELGHVWIFTHHPYLQTERLANTVAMRAVPRESLERVYGKLRDRDGTSRDLARFLGPQ